MSLRHHQFFSYLYTFISKLRCMNLAESLLPESLGFQNTGRSHISVVFRVEQRRPCCWVSRFALGLILFILPPPCSCARWDGILSILQWQAGGGEWWKHWSGRGSAGWGRKNGYWVDWMLCFANSWFSSSPFGLGGNHHHPPSFSGQVSEGHICCCLFPSVSEILRLHVKGMNPTFIFLN